MESYRHRVRSLKRFAGEVVAETLWPTRCALCDRLGSVLCDECARRLTFLDWWRACPRCGSPFGLVQCDWCNPVSLSWFGRESLPFSGCASAVMFGESSGQLVRVYKDQGERRLATVMAEIMTRVVPSAWSFDEVTFVPASKKAFRRRGFDHMELLAEELSRLLGCACVRSFVRPRALDQRALGGRGRAENLAHGFTLLEGTACAGSYLLLDDVFTTGSTMCAAADALIAGGAQAVFCLTFARV